MFWFRLGLFTLMYMDSLMVPGLPPDLPSYDVEVVVFYGMSCSLGMSVYGGRLF